MQTQHSGTATVSPTSTPTSVHREPVVAADGHVVGYVVSVARQPAVPTQAHDTEQRQLASDAVHQAYLSLDLASVVADRYAFLPATPAMLEGWVPTPVVPGRLVLDLPVGFESRPAAVVQTQALRGLGMELALQGYVGTPQQDALLPLVGFAVIDAARVDPAALGALVHRAHTMQTRVLATNVTDQATMDRFLAAGIDGFRGLYAERRPAPDAKAPSRVLRAGELQCLALMHLLQQPEVVFSDVSQVIDTDPVLTLRVLHLVNSGAFGVAHQVDTVHQAAVLLGTRELTTLVGAMLVEARPDAMDSLWFILARALTCEELAGDGAAYTVGMLSALAGQLGVPVDVVLDKVGVSDAVAEAVRSEAGPLGAALAAVRAHERKDLDDVVSAGFEPAEVSQTYVRCLTDALATARTVTRAGL